MSSTELIAAVFCAGRYGQIARSAHQPDASTAQSLTYSTAAICVFCAGKSGRTARSAQPQSAPTAQTPICSEWEDGQERSACRASRCTEASVSPATTPNVSAVSTITSWTRTVQVACPAGCAGLTAYCATKPSVLAVRGSTRSTERSASCARWSGRAANSVIFLRGATTAWRPIFPTEAPVKPTAR